MTTPAKPMASRDALLLAKFQNDVPTHKLVQEFKISRQRIFQIARRAGIARARGSCSQAPRATHLLMEACRQEIEQAYADDQPLVGIAAEVGVCVDTVVRHLKMWGVQLRPYRTPQERIDRWISMYLDDEMSTSEIARREGVGQSLVHTRLSSSGIKMRTMSEAVSLAKRQKSGVP